MIREFIETCKNRGDQTAFVFGNRRKSFSELLADVFRTVNLFKERGVVKDKKILLLVLPSYEFYVLLFACIYYGINVVVMDSYKDLGRIKETMSAHGIDSVFCTSLTRFAAFKLGADIRAVNISSYSEYPSTAEPPSLDKEKILLTTFTSGTTGTPKPIERSIKSLEEQIGIISKNITIDQDSIVYADLPVYVLFIIYSGITCVISRRIRNGRLKNLGVTSVVAPISKLLKIKEPLPFVKELYLGGATLYMKECRRLKELFPLAESVYIYGSSECVLMAKSTLDHYMAHGFAMKDKIDGVDLAIVEKDKSGIGRIKATGESVLTDTRQHIGGDLGYFDNYGLHTVGRYLYSTEDRYNYVEDDRLLSENPRVTKGFFFSHEGKNYFCYQGKLSKQYEDIICIRFRKLPMDPKHRTKLNYTKAIELINKAKRKNER